MLWMIDNYDSFVHNLATYFVELGREIKIIRNDKVDLMELKNAVETREVGALCTHFESNTLDGLIISPGPKSPKDCGLCKEAIQIAAGKIPVLGVCLGHQIIAESYGASVVHGEKPMHGKLSTITHGRSDLFNHIPKNFDVTRYHSLVVSDNNFPTCLQIDARVVANSSEACAVTCSNGLNHADNAIMAISHRELPIYGVQFHPEAVLSEYGHQILQNFAHICEAWKNTRQLSPCKQAV